MPLSPVRGASVFSIPTGFDKLSLLVDPRTRGNYLYGIAWNRPSDRISSPLHTRGWFSIDWPLSPAELSEPSASQPVTSLIPRALPNRHLDNPLASPPTPDPLRASRALTASKASARVQRTAPRVPQQGGGSFCISSMIHSFCAQGSLLSLAKWVEGTEGEDFGGHLATTTHGNISNSC